VTRTERVCSITQILCATPNKDYSLGYFSERFGCAKSSVSEDMKVVRASMEDTGLGYLETTSGSKGGVRFVPYITNKLAYEKMEIIRDELMAADRRIGKGFFYTTDIVFKPEWARDVARVFAKHFAATDADVVVTVETKGIGIALFTAELLNLPLAVIRREAKITEGSTLSINYFSGSSDRIQTMSLSKRALKPGAKALLIDDFMRGGGSIDGMKEMLAEFDATVAGVGVFIAAGKFPKGFRDDVYCLLKVDDSNDNMKIDINISAD